MEILTPTNYKMSTGVGYGDELITAFDKALLDAGVGNYNLVRLSSILPIDAKKQTTIDLPMGSLLPIAYATISARCGDIAKAAIAIGRPVDKDKCNVIMEYETNSLSEDAEGVVRMMVVEGFRARGWELESIDSVSIETEYFDGNGYAVAFACVAEW